MSDKSPLFVSAVELLAHGTELYSQGNERKYKFVILHLANSVELILKDRLVDKGVSIYLQRKPQTIGIWEAFDELQKVAVNIPERPVLELLIDDRNTIQHRFGFPNAETVFYYLEQTVAFFKRFFTEEYNVDIAEVLKLHLSDDDLALIGLAKKKDDMYASLEKLFELSPESAVLQAFNAIDQKYIELTGMPHSYSGRPLMFYQSPDFRHLLHTMELEGFLAPDSEINFKFLREMRNRAAHAAHFQNDLDSPDWAKALKVAKDFISGMDKAAQSGKFSKKNADRSVVENAEHAPAEAENNQSSS